MKEKILEWVVALALLGGAWWYAGHLAVAEYKQELAIEQAKADRQQQDKYNKLAEEYEVLRSKRNENATTIIREVAKVVDRPVYRNICVDDSGLSIANQAITGRADSGEPNAKMPSAD